MTHNAVSSMSIMQTDRCEKGRQQLPPRQKSISITDMEDMINSYPIGEKIDKQLNKLRIGVGGGSTVDQQTIRLSMGCYTYVTLGWMMVEPTGVIANQYISRLSRRYAQSLIFLPSPKFTLLVVIAAGVTAGFMGRHFAMTIDVGLKCEIYCLVIRTMLGQSIVKDAYKIQIDRIYRSNKWKHRSDIQGSLQGKFEGKFEGKFDKSSTIIKPKTNHSLLRKPKGKHQMNSSHNQNMNNSHQNMNMIENTRSLIQDMEEQQRLQQYKSVIKESLYVPPIIKKPPAKISVVDYVRAVEGDDNDNDKQNKHKYKYNGTQEMSPMVSLLTDKPPQKQFTLHCSPSKIIPHLSVIRKKTEADDTPVETTTETAVTIQNIFGRKRIDWGHVIKQMKKDTYQYKTLKYSEQPDEEAEAKGKTKTKIEEEGEEEEGDDLRQSERLRQMLMDAKSRYSQACDTPKCTLPPIFPPPPTSTPTPPPIKYTKLPLPQHSQIPILLAKPKSFAVVEQHTRMPLNRLKAFHKKFDLQCVLRDKIISKQ